MRVYSFVRKGIDLEEVEIEISLVPGLPNFQLIGLPDASIKESLLRLKSAIRHQGYKLPTRDQVLIHLKPSHERKSSQGLDLAIAAAYLLKTEQIKLVVANPEDKIYFYGEVTLEGEVTAPQDLELLEELPPQSYVLTGAHEKSLGIQHGLICSLRDLERVEWREPQFDCGERLARNATHLELLDFSQPIADILTIAGTGEHSVFVAGPAGTGKSTFSEALHAVLRAPTTDEQKRIDKISRVLKRPLCGRPYVAPHHSATDIALLGGGVPPAPGEITRAQHGIFFMDEFLEYKSYVKESLREPIERREITVARAGGGTTFPADFLLVGASNLCPCGEFVPDREARCGQYSTYCKSYLRRLSGPLLDRFEMVEFSHQWTSAKKCKLADVRKWVATAQAFAENARRQKVVNSRLTLAECEATMSEFTRQNLLPEIPASHRRRQALLRVARTLADLEGSEFIEGRHLESARKHTLLPFGAIKQAWR